MATITRMTDDPTINRFAELVKGLKNRTGSYDLLGKQLKVSPMAINKWAERSIDDINNLKLGNIRAIADALGWGVDELLHYCEGTTPAQTDFSISALSFEQKIALNLELAKSLIQEKEGTSLEPLDLSDKERLKLGKLLDASLFKSGELVASVAASSGLSIAKVEAIANADEDLEITMGDLDKLAPFCFRPTRWDGNRPHPGDVRLQNGAELLAAIRNGNGAKSK